MNETGLTSPLLEETISRLTPALRDEGLDRLFANALRNTLATTVQLMDDGTTFVITGDIAAMWLRDSSGQVTPYLRFCRDDALLRRVVHGLIVRQARCILVDPYANAFRPAPEGLFNEPADQTEQRPGVFERKYELDSLCYPLRLLRLFSAATGDDGLYGDPDVARAIAAILQTMQVEQDHAARSPYHFRRPFFALPFHDTDRAHPVAPTGMVWTAFRPSDDGCTYNYLIPAQMFAVVELRHLAQAPVPVESQALASRLAAEIDAGIAQYGIVDHPQAGRIYAYEVDGLGHDNPMDDANVPSLLAAPYLGYCAPDDEPYANTRRFVLSQGNPYYYHGRYAEGIGSPHTPVPYVWPLGLSMEGLTAGRERALELLRVLRDTDGGTGYLHESFDPDDPRRYTRPWFAWANSLFAELVLQVFDS